LVFTFPLFFKKLLAKERCTQLQHVSNGSFGSKGRGGNGGSPPTAPLIVYEEDEETGELTRRTTATMPQQQQQSVDRREAARLAYWSRPELSCEGLALRTKNNNSQQQKMPDEPIQQAPMIIEPDIRVCGFGRKLWALHTNIQPCRPPLAQQEGGSSASSTPPMKRLLSAAFLSSSQDHLNLRNIKDKDNNNKGADSSPLLLGPRPVSRRASAMASLLDPISIGAGDRRESCVSMLGGNVGIQGGGGGGGQSMTPQGKWRHAIRKLQMNKWVFGGISIHDKNIWHMPFFRREAGRMQAKQIDAWSRILFPFSYTAFQLAYWYYYLRVAS
jgi:hypothetical protein